MARPEGVKVGDRVEHASQPAMTGTLVALEDRDGMVGVVWDDGPDVVESNHAATVVAAR